VIVVLACVHFTFSLLEKMENEKIRTKAKLLESFVNRRRTDKQQGRNYREAYYVDCVKSGIFYKLSLF